jgi:hypothetical protein
MREGQQHVVLCSETRTAQRETKAPDKVADMSFFEFLRRLEYKAGMHAHSEESRLSASVPEPAVRQGRHERLLRVTSARRGPINRGSHREFNVGPGWAPGGRSTSLAGSMTMFA